jgi:hypothetical protein
MTSSFLERYDDVRARYRLPSSAMCMRIKRFIERGGCFPKETDPVRGRIRKLYVTPELDALLKIPCKKYFVR